MPPEVHVLLGIDFEGDDDMVMAFDTLPKAEHEKAVQNALQQNTRWAKLKREFKIVSVRVQ